MLDFLLFALFCRFTKIENGTMTQQKYTNLSNFHRKRQSERARVSGNLDIIHNMYTEQRTVHLISL